MEIHPTAVKEETGFSAVEMLLCLIIVILITFVGYYIYNTKKNADAAYKAASTAAQASAPRTTRKAQPALSSSTSSVRTLGSNGKTSYVLPDGWEVVSAQSGPAKTSNCTKTITKDPGCIDVAVLVLKSEGYTNADQFHATISLYNKDPNQSVDAWFSSLGMGDGAKPPTDILAINGMPALKFVDSYTNESRISYAMTLGSYGVIVDSDLFSGDHYSFKTTNNYLTYASVIDSLAHSVAVE